MTPLIGWRLRNLRSSCRNAAQPAASARAFGILRGVAARRVEQDRLVREPPVAVARAADAAQRLLAELLRQRKVQAGVHQHRGLARARRADDDVPRQLVEIRRALARCDFLSASIASSKRLRSCAASARAARAASHLAGILRAATSDASLLARACAAQLLELQQRRPRRRRSPESTTQPRDRAFERLVLREREVRAREPDQQRQQQQPERGPGTVRLLRMAIMVSSSLRWTISTRRLRARFSGRSAGCSAARASPCPRPRRAGIRQHCRE